ncbi:MAG: NAD-dependent dehydratase [Pseudomonadota bacterium]
MKLLILGATGLVGRHVLQAALNDPRIGLVLAPTRRPLPAHAKLTNPVAPELEVALANMPRQPVDAMVCALGTTMAKAGSREAFRHADYVLPLGFARRAYEEGAQAISLVSSPGASFSVPFFYSRTKAELERDIAAVGFPSVTIVRPGMIGGAREEFRLAERLVLPVARLLQPILSKGLWINPAVTIAQVLLEAVIARDKGVRLLTSRNIVDAVAR